MRFGISRETGGVLMTIRHSKVKETPQTCAPYRDAVGLGEVVLSGFLEAEPTNCGSSLSLGPEMIDWCISATNGHDLAARLYDFTCQICGTRLATPAGAYAEICHIKPLGRPHNGPDVPENILCLCPAKGSSFLFLGNFARILFGEERCPASRPATLCRFPRPCLSILFCLVYS
jgi:hypothetical protein